MHNFQIYATAYQKIGEKFLFLFKYFCQKELVCRGTQVKNTAIDYAAISNIKYHLKSKVESEVSSM